jgi:hypothetical protein
MEGKSYLDVFLAQPGPASLPTHQVPFNAFQRFAGSRCPPSLLLSQFNHCRQHQHPSRKAIDSNRLTDSVIHYRLRQAWQVDPSWRRSVESEGMVGVEKMLIGALTQPSEVLLFEGAKYSF